MIERELRRLGLTWADLEPRCKAFVDGINLYSALLLECL